VELLRPATRGGADEDSDAADSSMTSKPTSPSAGATSGAGSADQTSIRASLSSKDGAGKDAAGGAAASAAGAAAAAAAASSSEHSAATMSLKVRFRCSHYISLEKWY
jgi:hypothetical protein